MAFAIFSISEEGFSWFGFAGFNASVIIFFRAPVYNGGNHQATLRSKTPHVIRWWNDVSDTERQGIAI